MHLHLDGPCRNTEIMRNRDLLAKWLHDTAIKADMTPHGAPLIDGFAWPGSDDQEALSGVQFLKESTITMLTYISAHMWPEVAYGFVDIFSCRDFDRRGVETHVRLTLKMRPDRSLLLDRGVNPTTGLIIPAQVRTELGETEHGIDQR